IQRLKFHLIKPTILAIIVLFLIYSVLVGSYFVQTQKYPESGFKKAKIEISNLQPSLISD
ncbi:MAG TPA: hypothetical protein VJ824_09640, partial [Bacillota bacterium]|nr:hypothetical protein [Bacillota bacterium]